MNEYMCINGYMKKKKNKKTMIKPSSLMCTLECIRPCEAGKRAIATYNRNKNNVRAHSCMSAKQDTR